MQKNDAGLYEAEIDGKTYEFQKWSASKSIERFGEVMGMIADPFGKLAGGFIGGGGLKQEFNPDVAGMAISSILKSLSEKKNLDLVKKLCTDGVLCERVSIKSFDDHYDSILHIGKVAKANVEVQWSDFLAEFRALVVAPAESPKVIVQGPQT